MSVADFKKYGQLIAERSDVRAQAKAIGMNDLAGQIAYAKTLGLEFSAADMTELAKQAGASSNELSEAQLEQVAGGTSTITAVIAATVGPIYQMTQGIAAQASASRNW